MASKLFKSGFSSAPIEHEPVEVQEEAPVFLDEQQKAAVESNSENILVVAGAGSGKTRVLTERIKELLNRGVHPSNIVAITFTNMAADEMKERLCNIPNIGDAFIGTIHSFANRVMKLSGEKYMLYTEELDLKYHGILIKKYCHFLTYDRFLEYRDMQKEALIGRISENEVLDFLSVPERGELLLIERRKWEIDAEIEKRGDTDFPESIETLCRKNRVITFDELLKRAERYFRSINAHVEHVLVDEFQDVGTLEFKFIEALQADNYFLVGDDYQSIYGFKGGNVKIFMKLITDGLFDVYYLTNNYRNGTAILQIANMVINQVGVKIDKTVTPRVESTGQVKVFSKQSIYSQLQAIKSSKDYKDWFILTRTNRDLYKVAEMCSDMEIPFTTFKREGMSLNDMRKRMNQNRVKILTVHTSKGLETKNVLLYGNFPIVCPPYRLDEDERKVMYVGCTRAKENLVILN